MFASGLALAQPELKIWAFMGDGAFCMNPGMLMVERQMNLPNLTHFLVSNRVYGATSNAGLPNAARQRLRRHRARHGARARIRDSAASSTLEREFPALKAANAPGHTFVVLEVEPFSDAEQKLEQPPFDGPELKFRFGRHVESLTGARRFWVQNLRRGLRNMCRARSYEIPADAARRLASNRRPGAANPRPTCSRSRDWSWRPLRSRRDR